MWAFAVYLVSSPTKPDSLEFRLQVNQPLGTIPRLMSEDSTRAYELKPRLAQPLLLSLEKTKFFRRWCFLFLEKFCKFFKQKFDWNVKIPKKWNWSRKIFFFAKILLQKFLVKLIQSLNSSDFYFRLYLFDELGTFLRLATHYKT